MNGSLFQQTLSRGLQDFPTERITPRQWQVLHHLMDCRTQSMGSYHWHCPHCDQDTYWYCSCRDRHCPCCQGHAREQWLTKRQEDTLPVPYHHLVFTLPHQFNGWADVHPKLLYHSLFRVVWETLQAFANRRHHLDGQLGMLAVLHTWGQSLCRHIHLHCLIPGGVLTTAQEWQSARNADYLLPVKALSAKFKGKMLARLRDSASAGELARITPEDIRLKLADAAKTDWVVYSKPTLTHTDDVVAYLSRYCNRVGVSESRLSLDNEEQVRLRYKDYRTGQLSTMRFEAPEFLRRFLLHVLPKGFMRLRYYGFLANAVRRKALVWIRKSLKRDVKEEDQEHHEPDTAVSSSTVICPNCKQPGLLFVGIVNEVPVTSSG